MLPHYDDRGFFWRLRMGCFWTVGFIGFFVWMPINLVWKAFFEREER